jgi:hypothetical protein
MLLVGTQQDSRKGGAKGIQYADFAEVGWPATSSSAKAFARTNLTVPAPSSHGSASLVEPIPTSAKSGYQYADFAEVGWPAT